MRSDEVIALLEQQRAVRGFRSLAATLAGAGEVVSLVPGQALLRQEEDGSAIFFLLLGAVRIEVNGRIVARRVAGEAIGEMAAIDPRALRAATAIVTEAGAALRVSEPRLGEVGERFPTLWRNLAAELAERLRESNRAFRSPNPIPIVMVRASMVGTRAGLGRVLAESGASIRAWSEDLPPQSWHAALSEVDFAIQVQERGTPPPWAEQWLGLCAGILGRGRAFAVVPSPDAQALPCCERLAWDPEDDPTMSAPGAALLAAVTDLGPR